jgi:squalene-hopene/tetraprenyl-beta-curcumene cyclase
MAPGFTISGQCHGIALPQGNWTTPALLLATMGGGICGGPKMTFRLASCVALMLLSRIAVADEPTAAREAIDRGLAFVEQDAVKWRKERTCATCHHGAMTVWAMSEAKRQGIDVKPETFADVVAWTKERLKDIDKPRDTRLGWSMVNSPALNLAAMAEAIPQQDALSAEELRKIAGHLVRHQEAEGQWAWSAAPVANRPPPFFESDEVATVLGLIDMRPHLPAAPQEKSEFRDSYSKAGAWLAKATPTETTQSLAYRLFRDVQLKKSAEDLQPQVDRLLARQNQDGGWGQLKDAASDAYATGQALYFLRIAGVPGDREPIQRGVKFLVSTQKEDGSWPMVRRGHEGVTPGPFIIPITYFGSAWGTMGLLRATGK